MGYLTPILIDNDAFSFAKENADEVVNALNNAVSSKNEKKLFSNGRDFVHSLGTRHSNSTRVIVVHGGTWVDITRYLYEFYKDRRVGTWTRSNIFLDKVKKITAKILSGKSEWEKENKKF